MDIVDLARMETALRRTPRLAARLFTKGERAAWDEHAVSARSVDSLAGCFAAKEALAKVLGAPAGLRWTDAEVVRERSGRPRLHVRGTVAAAAARQGVTNWHLSISHDGGMCVAMVVGEHVPGRPERAVGRPARAERVELADRVEPARRAAR